MVAISNQMGGYDVLTSDISQTNLLGKTFLFSRCSPLKRIMQIELVECQDTQQGADILQLPRNPRTKILPNGGLLMLMETSHPKKGRIPDPGIRPVVWFLHRSLFWFEILDNPLTPWFPSLHTTSSGWRCRLNSSKTFNAAIQALDLTGWSAGRLVKCEVLKPDLPGGLVEG